VAFNPKDLGAYRDFLDTQSKISKVMSKSSKDFASGIKDAVVAKRDLNKLQKQATRLEKEELALRKEMESLSGEELKNAEAKLAAIRQERKETDKLLQQQKALSAALSNQVKSVKNLTVAVGRDLLKATSKVVKKAAELGKEFTDIDDSMRRTAINVGIVGKQMNTLRRNAYKAALVTQRFGVDAKELVQMYGSYVDEVGRLIPMTQQSAIAMARMAKNTSLGAEGAASFAASMEVMGMSVEGTAKYVDEINLTAKKLGVNSGKTIKLLASNLKKAQTVRFKGGVDGMSKMAAKAVALRADMSATLGLAQDLWEPEKAIETAASLQMMGGAFARMADPLKLMFDARNNPEKLMTDLASAAASVVKQGKDGLYTIPTMELQKLKQVAEATNQDFEQLVETAKTSAKRNDIGKMLSPKIKGESRDLIKSLATFNSKSGKFEIEVGGKAMAVSKISQNIAQQLVLEGKETEKRAEAAQSFMTRVKQMMDSLKNLAMRFFMGMEGPMRTLLDQITGTGGLQSLGDKMEELGKSVGNWIASVGVPFIQGVIPLIKVGIAKLTEMVGATSKWVNDKLIPITKSVIKYLEGFWAENGDFIKGLLRAAMGLSKAVWKVLRFLGPEGALAAILLVKFPAILRGIIGTMKGMFGGLRNALSGGQRGSQGNPMYVVNMGGGMGGGGGGGMMDMIDPYGSGGRYGGRNAARSGARGGMGRVFKAFRKGGFKGGFKALGRMRTAGAFGSMLMGKGGRKAFGKVAAGAGIKSAAGRMGGGLLARVGGGLAKGGPLALIGVGAEVGRMFMDNPDSFGGKALGVLGTTASDAAMGAMIGSVIPVVGNVAGAIIGGIIGLGRGLYREITTKTADDYNMGGAKSDIGSHSISTAGTSFLADGAVMPNGNVIKTAKGKMYRLSPRDVMSIGQPGSGSSYGGAGGTIRLDINGTIKLSSGSGRDIELNELADNPEFRQKITAIVVNQMEMGNR